MGYLGQRDATGVLSADNPFSAGGWAVSFTPADLAIQEPFEIYHIAVQGPNDPASNLQLWLDTTFYSTTPRGDVNDYDPNWGIYVRPGQSVNLYWDTTINPAPKVSIFCRQPNPF